jgi:hypothetical protein
MTNDRPNTTSGRSTRPNPPLTEPDVMVRLYTPAQAAEALAVPESWLRRKAGRRLIPCTFVGKHLRFSSVNLCEIADNGSQAVRLPRRGGRAA